MSRCRFLNGEKALNQSLIWHYIFNIPTYTFTGDNRLLIGLQRRCLLSDWSNVIEIRARQQAPTGRVELMRSPSNFKTQCRVTLIREAAVIQHPKLWLSMLSFVYIFVKLSICTIKHNIIPHIHALVFSSGISLYVYVIRVCILIPSAWGNIWQGVYLNFAIVNNLLDLNCKNNIIVCLIIVEFRS